MSSEASVEVKGRCEAFVSAYLHLSETGVVNRGCQAGPKRGGGGVLKTLILLLSQGTWAWIHHPFPSGPPNKLC